MLMKGKGVIEKPREWQDRRKDAFNFRRTAFWCSNSLPQTPASISIKFSMPSGVLYHSKAPESPKSWDHEQSWNWPAPAKIVPFYPYAPKIRSVSI
jgi:hypothetical protein